ncbi:MAG: hypothetical protein GX580_03910, partial [Candidatus Hydrogenedens sp.]|nr:hypothetical protein [Candidatus Hydrogenedens sp.]
MKFTGCLWVLGMGLCLAAGAEGFQAGFARTDLTPAVGAQMPGGYNEHLSKGVRDPLFAEAAVFTSGETTVAVVGVDLIMI